MMFMCFESQPVVVFQTGIHDLNTGHNSEHEISSLDFAFMEQEYFCVYRGTVIK